MSNRPATVTTQIALQNTPAYRAFFALNERLRLAFADARLRQVPNSPMMESVGVFGHYFFADDGANIRLEMDIIRRETRVIRRTVADCTTEVLPKGSTVGQIAQAVINLCRAA